MEPSCRDTSSWIPGVVKGKLGTKLYVDLADPEDSKSFENGIQTLIQEIKLITGHNSTQDTFDVNAMSSASDTNISKAKIGPGASSDDIKIGTKAIECLGFMAFSEPLRSMMESTDVLEFITALFDYEGTKVHAGKLLINVYGPLVDLKGGDVDTLERYNRARQLMHSQDCIDLIFSGLNESFQTAHCNHSTFSNALELSLIEIRNLSMCEEFREQIIVTVGEILVEILVEGHHFLTKLLNIHKILATETILHCALTESLRPSLESLGAKGALQVAFEGVTEADKNSTIDNDNSQLKYLLRQALDTFEGFLNGKDGVSMFGPVWFKKFVDNSSPQHGKSLGNTNLTTLSSIEFNIVQ